MKRPWSLWLDIKPGTFAKARRELSSEKILKMSPKDWVRYAKKIRPAVSSAVGVEEKK